MQDLLKSLPPADGYKVTQEALVGISATEFWNAFLDDNAEEGFDKFLEGRGE